MIAIGEAGNLKHTSWRSLRAVKCWATRYRHAWRMEGKILIVSTADGQIFRYRETPIPAQKRTM